MIVSFITFYVQKSDIKVRSKLKSTLLLHCIWHIKKNLWKYQPYKQQLALKSPDAIEQFHFIITSTRVSSWLANFCTHTQQSNVGRKLRKWNRITIYKKTTSSVCVKNCMTQLFHLCLQRHNSIIMSTTPSSSSVGCDQPDIFLMTFEADP